MCKHETEPLRTIRSLREVFEFAGHDVLAGQMRQLDEQVEGIVEDLRAAIEELNSTRSRIQWLELNVGSSCDACFWLTLANARVKRLEAAMRNHGIWPAKKTTE